ncbi:MAG TPA: hypothetical protein VKC34_17760 [Blastocatellia bacterium]|nr:hypothetical protein [Blastocatellia bacterium]
MNNSKDETGESTMRGKHLEASRREEINGAQEAALGDLEPRAEIKGGSLSTGNTVTDVTLKRGSGG